jgi:CRP/FNR family transcriptional regulator, cyclic AMP receptor protein
MSTLTGQTHEQFLSALQTTKNSLEYLTPNDWKLIIDRAKQRRFKKAEELLREGRQVRAMYLVVAGEVKVTARGALLAKLGPGQVCGEMGFLENDVASATAVAEDDVVAYVLEWQELMDLFEMFPHLASRFYRCLAVNLSRRLREQIVRKRTGA